MFALDLFNTPYEKELQEGAVDNTVARLIEPLSLRAAEIRTQLRNGNLKGSEMAALEKEYEDLVAKRLDIIHGRQPTTQDECMGYGGLGEAGIGQDIVNRTEKMARATPSTPTGKVASTVKNAAKWLAGKGGPGQEGPTYESAQKKNSEQIAEEQQLHMGDPIVVTAPNEFEGKTGEIRELSPSGKFVIVDLYNHGQHSMHLSDVKYNDYTDQEEADDWYDEELDESANPKLDQLIKMIQAGKITAAGLKDPAVRPRIMQLVQQADPQANIDQLIATYAPAAQIKATNVNDLKSAARQGVVNAPYPKTSAGTPGYAQQHSTFEGYQDFNRVEPYAVCLAGKPVKKFDYYEDARRFHDNWKKKLYREGNKEKADKITLMPLNLDEAMNKNDLLGNVAKDLNPQFKKAKSGKLKASGDFTKGDHWKGAKPGDYGYTGYQGHGMPTDKAERDRIRADKKKGVAEGATVAYIVTVVDPETYEKKKLNISALTKEHAKEKAESKGYKVLRVDSEQGVAEGQLNEYFVRSGDDIASVFSLNLFKDLLGDTSLSNHDEEFANSPEWQAVVATWAPKAEHIQKEIYKYQNIGRKLRDAEADAIDATVYDGRDAYENAETAASYLPKVYNKQASAIVRLLKDGFANPPEGMHEDDGRVTSDGPIRLPTSPTIEPNSDYWTTEWPKEVRRKKQELLKDFSQNAKLVEIEWAFKHKAFMSKEQILDYLDQTINDPDLTPLEYMHNNGYSTDSMLKGMLKWLFALGLSQADIFGIIRSARRGNTDVSPAMISRVARQALRTEMTEDQSFVPAVGDEIMWRPKNAKMVPTLVTVVATTPDKLKIKLQSPGMIQRAGKDTIVVGINNSDIFPKQGVAEAGSPAQQAAIAIAMKRAGKKPKSVNEAINLTESRTYRLWESAGRKIMEAQLTTAQIQQLFQQAEQGANAAGSNRTMIGKGKDAATAVNQAWEQLKTKVQNSGPIKNVDAAYDQAAEKLKQATGGDAGVMQYVEKYRAFAKAHPIAQSLIYAALIAAAGISGAGVGGAAALGLLKMTDKLLQGEKFSSAAYSGAKTGATAYAAGQIGKALQGGDQTAQAGQQAASGLGRTALSTFQNDPTYGKQLATIIGDKQINPGWMQEFTKQLGRQVADPGDPRSMSQAWTNASRIANSIAGNPYGALGSLKESQIKRIFYTAAGLQTQLNEGMWDSIKGAAGNAVGAIANKAKTIGTNLTTKVTADTLMSAWKSAGSPTDSEAVADVMRKAGVDEQIINSVLATVANAPNTTTAKTHTGGRVAGQLSQTPNAIRQRQARAAQKQPATGGAGAFGQMAQQVTATTPTPTPQISSTGGTIQRTATGLTHTANPTNPNAKKKEQGMAETTAFLAQGPRLSYGDQAEHATLGPVQVERHMPDGSVVVHCERDGKKYRTSPSSLKLSVAEDQDTSSVESAIIRRIMVAHTDLLKQFGPEKVMQAAEEVAYNVGDVDEIGTSDISAYVNQVKQILGAE